MAATVMSAESEYDLTEDQRQAMLEMARLQGELDDDADYDYGPMPDYSETISRLKEINEQWESEPLPEDSSRIRMVEFSSEVQARDAPAVEYESEGDDQSDYPEDRDANRDYSEEGGFTEPWKSNSVDDQGEHSHPHKPQNDSQILHANKSASSSDEAHKENNKQGSVTPSTEYRHNSRSSSHYNGKRDEFDKGEESAGNTNNSNGLTNWRKAEQLEARNGINPLESPESQKSELNEQTNQSANNNSAHTSNDRENSSHGAEATSSSSDNANQEGKEERVLIEINGKFEYLSIDELQARGYPVPVDYTPPSSKSESQPDSRSRTESQPDSRSRPTTSSGTRPTAELAKAVPRQRAQSATHSTSHRGTDEYAEGYVSPYGLTKEQRELKERREKLARERLQTQAERKKEEERRKREENESAFEWWLQKKEEDRKSGANQSNSEEDKKARQEDNEKAFKAWMDAKKEQQKHEKLLKSREQRERDDSYFIRSREECEKAYKQWLRNKWKEQNRAYYGSSSSAKSKTGRRKKLRIKSKPASASSSMKSSDKYAYKLI